MPDITIKSEPIQIFHWEVNLDNYDQDIILEYKLKTMHVLLNDTDLKVGIGFRMTSRYNTKKGQCCGCVAESKYIIDELQH